MGLFGARRGSNPGRSERRASGGASHWARSEDVAKEGASALLYLRREARVDAADFRR